MTTPLIARDGRLRAVVRAVRPSDRACGACTACCTAMHVEELDKPAGHTCPSARASRRGGGCAIYTDRPTSCREFQCLWLRGLRTTLPEHRPDRLGLMLIPTLEPRTIDARELQPGASATVNSMFLLHALREAGLTVRIVTPPVVATPITIGGRALCR